MNKNSCEGSEQIRRLLETYLVLVQHGGGSRVTSPVGVCQVGAQPARVPPAAVAQRGLPTGCFLGLFLQVLSQTVAVAGLSTTCRKMLLDVISALILGGNVSLPDTLVKETIERVITSAHGT